MAVRVRFAPSPTGYLHVGGARTALFNWLLAHNARLRGEEAAFVLRIEDTDQVRNNEDAVAAIFDGLKWLGLNWDEGPGAAEPHAPYFQSQRVGLYQAAIAQLKAAGRAFDCYLSPEELEAKRNEAAAENRPFRYDRRWALDLSPEQIAAYQAEGRVPVVRFAAPSEGTEVVEDLVKGRVEFNLAEMVDDFVLLKRDGMATYNFACVVDDAHMGITHVLRGDDHLSNTPKQIALYRALGHEVPRFGHLTMILGADKAKLSKRHGAVSVTQYRDEGYLPEALVNHLARLGWSHGDDELFTREQLTEYFDGSSLQKAAAVFDHAKLEWVNAHWLKEADTARLAELLQAHLPEAKGQDPAWLAHLVGSLKDRSRTLVQLAEGAKPYFGDSVAEWDEKAVAKNLGPEALAVLAELRGRLAAAEGWDEASLSPIFQGLAEEKGLKLGGVIQPSRVALTGRGVSPGIYDVLQLLGRERSLRRLDEAQAKQPQAAVGG